jgi:ribonuclease P protein component
MTDNVKANLSTKQSPSCQDTRLSRTDGDEEWPSCFEKKAGEGTQTPDAGTLLINPAASNKRSHLRTSGDFRRVYEQGVRYDSRFLTAFVQPNGLSHHRFGITASRKAIGNAIKRNRSKRLLRETFRSNNAALDNLQMKYDWVFNAKRSLLSVKVLAPIEDFQKIISRVASDEGDGVHSLNDKHR